MHPRLLWLPLLPARRGAYIFPLAAFLIEDLFNLLIASFDRARFGSLFAFLDDTLILEPEPASIHYFRNGGVKLCICGGGAG